LASPNRIELYISPQPEAFEYFKELSDRGNKKAKCISTLRNDYNHIFQQSMKVEKLALNTGGHLKNLQLCV